MPPIAVTPKLVVPPFVVLVVRSCVLPLTARLPPAVRILFPLAVNSAVKPFTSTRLISVPIAVTVPVKSFVALPRVISPLVELRVLASRTVIFVPDNCVMLSTADTPNVPVVTTSPNSMPFASARITFNPLAVTVLPKSFVAVARVMFCPVAPISVVPVTNSLPVCFTSPVLVTPSAPPIVVTPKLVSP